MLVAMDSKQELLGPGNQLDQFAALHLDLSDLAIHGLHKRSTARTGHVCDFGLSYKCRAVTAQLELRLNHSSAPEVDWDVVQTKEG